LVKFLLTGEFINEKFPLKNNIPIFHQSIIPRVRQKIEPQKTPLILISCRNSETFKIQVSSKGNHPHFKVVVNQDT